MKADLLQQKEGLGKALPEPKDDDTTIVGKRRSRDTIRQLRSEIASLKGTVTELVEKAKADQMCIDENKNVRGHVPDTQGIARQKRVAVVHSLRGLCNRRENNGRFF